MEDKWNLMDDKTIFCTPKPTATSTVNRKSKTKQKENVIDSISNSDESLGILSIQSEDVGPYIDNIRLKDSSKSSLSYAKEQRTLASKTLQNRESKFYGLPSKYLKPSELSSTSDSYMDISKGSTVNESDLLKSGTVNNTSTPRSSISPLEGMQKVDIAESMAKMSLEIRNTDMSLESALKKLDEEYQKVRNSMSIQSDMFRPGDQIESQLLADEASWKKEKELPVEKVDFTIGNFDTSKMSISTLFRQRSEDISNIVPSSSRKSSITTELSNAELLKSLQSSLESIPFSISSIDMSTSSEKDFLDLSQNKSLSVTKIAQILQGSEETPTKLVDFMMKQYAGGHHLNSTNRSSSTLGNHKDSEIDSESSTLKIRDEDSGNFHPSTCSSNKENFNSINVPLQTNLGKMSSNITKSLTSIRTGSSLSDLPDGKLPIETTHAELVWGCVKPGRSESKQFTLRNRSANRLRLQCSLSSPSFRIKEAAEDNMKLLKFILRARETKTLTVSFSPLTDGAAIDEIVFSPCDPDLQQTRKQSIKLFGYGGTSHIKFGNNILKDSANRHWINLGNILGNSVSSEKVIISNRGTLPAFVFVEYVPKHFTVSKPSVSPNVLILAPNDQKEIIITFKPNGEDLKYLQNLTTSIFELGIIKVLSGPEATRGRIRRMCKLAIEKKLEINSLSNKLQKVFQGEAIPSDISSFSESINSLNTLLEGLSQKEIVIMLEKDLDCTLVPVLTNETSMFQSLFQENTLIENKTKNSCTLEPPSLLLTPPSKMSNFLFLASTSESSLCFQINVPKGITATPAYGTIQPYANNIIEIKITDTAQIKSSNFTVSVNVGDEVLYTNVKIIFI